MTLLHSDLGRSRGPAVKLYVAFSDSDEGIFGETEMPEDEPPQRVEQGPLEHLFFITLMVTIDYLRDAHELWDISRAAYANPNTRYLFNPSSVYEAGSPQHAWGQLFSGPVPIDHFGSPPHAWGQYWKTTQSQHFLTSTRPSKSSIVRVGFPWVRIANPCSFKAV